uniref:(northern house mosquito) hypothetical protein n=1 Tax=Culex pipiens TaxID=7175 RepID=A0A8D8DFB8_CULPI
MKEEAEKHKVGEKKSRCIAKQSERGEMGEGKVHHCEKSIFTRNILYKKRENKNKKTLRKSASVEEDDENKTETSAKMSGYGTLRTKCELYRCVKVRTNCEWIYLCVFFCSVNL